MSVLFIIYFLSPFRAVKVLRFPTLEIIYGSKVDIISNWGGRVKKFK